MRHPYSRLKAKASNTIKINLEANTARDLHLYAAYANGSEDSVIRESLLYIFKTDSGFADWKNHPENLLENPRKTRRATHLLTQPHGVAEAAKSGK